MIRKCILCNKFKLKRNLSYIQWRGRYLGNSYKDYYEGKCLESILCNPEDYNTKIIDKAIWIKGKLKSRKENKEIRIIQRKESIKRAKELCIDI